jgi:hypothetical protein
VAPEELVRLLDEVGVDPYAYRIDDDRSVSMEYIGISPWRGGADHPPPPDGAWLVFYAERGQRRSVKGFADWDAASEYFLRWVLGGGIHCAPPTLRSRL